VKQALVCSLFLVGFIALFLVKSEYIPPNPTRIYPDDATGIRPADGVEFYYNRETNVHYSVIGFKGNTFRILFVPVYLALFILVEVMISKAGILLSVIGAVAASLLCYLTAWVLGFLNWLRTDGGYDPGPSIIKCLYVCWGIIFVALALKIIFILYTGRRKTSLK
jgi:hypothetical protein